MAVMSATPQSVPSNLTVLLSQDNADGLPSSPPHDDQQTDQQADPSLMVVASSSAPAVILRQRKGQVVRSSYDEGDRDGFRRALMRPPDKLPASLSSASSPRVSSGAQGGVSSVSLAAARIPLTFPVRHHTSARPRAMTSEGSRYLNLIPPRDFAQGTGRHFSVNDQLIVPEDLSTKADGSIKRLSSMTDLQQESETQFGLNQSKKYASSADLASLHYGSPYAERLRQKEMLKANLNQRLKALREESLPTTSNQEEAKSVTEEEKKLPPVRLSNEVRNKRRAAHNRAVVDDLCDMVTELFMAESHLLKNAPLSFGVDEQTTSTRDKVLASVQSFVDSLPPRYALGVESPSEVLVHMRLTTAARSQKFRAAVHIVQLEHQQGSYSHHRLAKMDRPHSERALHLVTISCRNTDGLLEYITKLLGSGGARVVDADVMTIGDEITLDRFLVDMTGRLRLDKLQQYVESYLKKAHKDNDSQSDVEKRSSHRGSSDSLDVRNPQGTSYGPLYFHLPKLMGGISKQDFEAEAMSGVPLSHVLTPNLSSSPYGAVSSMGSMEGSQLLQDFQSRGTRELLTAHPTRSRAESHGNHPQAMQTTGEDQSEAPVTTLAPASAGRHALVDREAIYFSDHDADTVGSTALHDVLAVTRLKSLPVIPMEDLLLIESLGAGRVSTIFRAAWQKGVKEEDQSQTADNLEMVALKVASIDAATGDDADIQELKREADIAALLHHKNVCNLVGVASDPEYFVLAYQFCEGGSLFSLLSDTARYYEYLPIALDIASGCAYLHSMHIIHRDLKPQNILLTKDLRAKVADFGLSVTNQGQELTGETGSYRYMAPEVIRHENYSSNADVYSFGILLWQLITREIPFATLSPIQTAYAVAQGHRPKIPASTPTQLRQIITSCWDEDSHKRPSFTYIVMALADYAKMAFNPANVGAQTVQIANEMLANVHGNSTVNVDFSAPMSNHQPSSPPENAPTEVPTTSKRMFVDQIGPGSLNSNVGLEI